MPRAERRPDALSRERIVQTAIEILDADGENGLTFRALATRLETGAGAIYWHLANKDELLAATTDDVIADALAREGKIAAPAEAIRKLALRVFGAIDAHPWVGAQLSRAPWQYAMVQIFERIGVQLKALGVAKRALFFTATALLTYILGAATQNAANGHDPAHGADRDTFFEKVAASWRALDPATHPFIGQMADELHGHDDRKQFLAGIDLILAGISSVSSNGRTAPKTTVAA